jgi:tetratricopeptide (TPR) repeat protein
MAEGYLHFSVSFLQDQLSRLLRSRWRPLLWIWAIGGLLYAHSLLFDFVFFDDHYLILELQHFLRKFSNVRAAFLDDVFKSQYDSYYRPILTLSFMIDAWIGGTNLAMYHLTNIVLHLTSSTLVWFLFKRLQFHPTTAFLFTLLFTVHPVLSQAIYWIPGRNDPLMGIFVLMSTIKFIDYLKLPTKKSYFLHTLFWILALLSKETALFLIPIFLIYSYLFSGQKRALFLLIPAWALGIVLWQTLKNIAFENPMGLYPEILIKSLFFAWPALIQLFGKTIMPFNLAVLPSIEDTTLGYGILSALLIIWLIYKNPSKDMKKIGLGIAWFLILTIPTFMRPESQTVPFFLEFRLYLPIIGIFIILSEVRWGQAILKNNTNAAIYAVIFCIFSGITLVYGQNYKNHLSFWKSAVRSSPSLPMAHQNLGAMYYIEGNLDKAETTIRNALLLRPRSPLAYNNLGLIAMKKGKPQMAEEAFKTSLQIDPKYDDAAFHLGVLYYETRQLDKAKATWKYTLKINPNHPQTLARLALMAYRDHDEKMLRKYIQKLQLLNYPIPKPIRGPAPPKEAP